MLTLGVLTLLLVLLMLGMPIAFALGVSGAIGILTATGFTGMVSQVSSTSYRAVADSALAAIPLFVLMAELMHQGGMARQVFNAANKLLGWLPGGVGIAAVLASAGFAAVLGIEHGGLGHPRGDQPAGVQAARLRTVCGHRHRRDRRHAGGDDPAQHRHDHLRDHDPDVDRQAADRRR